MGNRSQDKPQNYEKPCLQTQSENYHQKNICQWGMSIFRRLLISKGTMIIIIIIIIAHKRSTHLKWFLEECNTYWMIPVFILSPCKQIMVMHIIFQKKHWRCFKGQIEVTRRFWKRNIQMISSRKKVKRWFEHYEFNS